MRADVLLVYPPFSVEERYARKVGKNIGGNLPPLGAASLAAFIREKGWSVGVIDCIALDLSAEAVAHRAAEAGAKVVGFSALTGNFHRAVDYAEALRQRLPDTLIIVGGHHPTIMPRELMCDHAVFDLAVVREGEHTLADLLERYRAGGWRRREFLEDHEELGGIRGIAYRRGAEAVLTEPRELIDDLDALPFPARDLLPMAEYIPLPNQYLRLPVVHMTAIRGCPYACTFCSNNAVFGRAIRSKSPSRTVDEIEHVMADYGAREISFWDDTMTARREWIEEFCDEIIRRRLDVTWTGYARVNTVDLSILKRMKQAGCWNLFYGFEAGDQQLLDNIGKGVALDTIRSAARWTREAGIEVRGSFMLALPGETPELARRTVEFAVELDCDYAQFCITTPYPGTKLWDDADKYGRLSRNFRDYHCWSPVFVPFGYRDEAEILAVERYAVRRFYLRPRFVWKCIRKIRSRDDVVRYVKGLRMLLGFV